MSTRDFNPSYIGSRPDIQRLIPPHAKQVLDVGCSNGTLGASIKASKGSIVYGIELSSEMARVASERIDKVFVGDASEIILHEKMYSLNVKFDVIIFADVLEHLTDPWSVLHGAVKYLECGGVIIASIPNVRHLDTIYNLLAKGHWPYRDRGIHDRTHLRFFTKKNVIELFTFAGLEIEQLHTHYRIVERPHRMNRIAKFLAIPALRGFLAFQYLVRARQKNFRS